MAELRPLKEAVGSVPIVLSDKFIFQFDMSRAVPKGYRPAILEEVVLNWRHNQEFRNALGKVLQVWTATMGLPDTHRHEISDDGRLISLRNDHDRFSQLPPEKAVFLYSNGNNTGRLAAGVSIGSGKRTLEVAANLPPLIRLREACVTVDQESERAALGAKRA